MYVADLITQYKTLLAYDLDNRSSQDSAPSDAQVILDLNLAKDLISRMIFQYDPSIVFTMTATANAASPYDLRDLTVVSRKVIRPMELIINNNPCLDSRSGNRGMWSVQELTRRYPSWRSDPAGKPFLGATVGNDKLIIYSAPTQSVIDAGGNYIAGQYLAADLVVPTTVTTGATSATQAVGSTAGMAAGTVIYFHGAGLERRVQSVTNSTTVVLTASLTTTTGETVSVSPDIPDDCRPAIAYLAAVHSGETTASEAEQWQRLQTYDARSARAIERTAKENKSALIDMSSLGRRVPAYMWG